MNVVSLILRALAILGAIAAAVGFVSVRGKVEDQSKALKAASQKYAAAQAEIEQTKADGEKAVAEERMKLKDIEKLQLEQKALADQATSQLAVARREVETAKKDAADKEKQVSNMKRDISAKNTEIASMKTKLAAGDPDKIKAQEAEIEALKKELTALKTPALAPKAETPGKPVYVDTQVLAYDTEAGLITLAVGEKQVRPNESLELIQDERELGTAVVMDVRPTFCIARIIPGTRGLPRIDKDTAVTYEKAP